MVTINIFALHHAGGTFDGKVKTFSEDELTSDEQKVKLLISDFLAACLSAFLLPVYTIKPGESLLDYFALPAGTGPSHLFDLGEMAFGTVLIHFSFSQTDAGVD